MLKIRPCQPSEEPTMADIVNDAAVAYRGHIPADRWHEPYMPLEELRSEIAAGVRFLGVERAGALLGIMGSQEVKDVTLIRHAYVRTSERGHGLGTLLLKQLLATTTRPVLIGTWRAATWAISFYERHGFQVVGDEEKNRLLKCYWTVPDRQIETSVVLADARWRARATAV